MNKAVGRILAPAVLATALSLSPALGYGTTFVLLGLAAVAAALWLRDAPSTSLRLVPLPRLAGDDLGRRRLVSSRVTMGEGHQRSRWNGWPHAPTLLFTLAFLLIALSAVVTMRSPADLLPLVGFSALLFYAPLTRLFGDPAALPRYALIGALAGLAATLFFRYGLGINRAAEGLWLTDPYRLAVTTLLGATLGLGTFFTRDRWRWLSLLGPVAAIGVIVLTGSRTALLGLPVLLLLTALCFVRRPATIVAVLAATAAIIAAALFIELPGTARTRLWDVIVRIAEGGEVSDAAINIRIGLYRAGAELFAANPLTGIGWTEALMVPVRALLTPEQLSWGKLVHLHNDALQFAVSGGVIGLAAWLMILAAPVVGHLQLPPEFRTPQKRHTLLVLVIGGFVLGLPDTFLAAPMTLTIYVVLTAAVVGNQHHTPS